MTRTRRPAGGPAEPAEPLPHVTAPAFVGRSRELASVREALSRPPALVLIDGEAGIGKTRLVGECLASPATPQHEVLVAVCPPLRQPSPLGPLVAALGSTRNRVGDLGLSPLAGALRPLLPEWADELPPAPEPLEEATATRHRLFRAVAELLDRLRMRVLVVEDAHSADCATLEFLLVTAFRQPPSLSLVVTYRGEEVPATSPLRQLMSRAPAGMTLARVGLEPLSPAETGQLVASMLATDQVSVEFAGLLHDRTDGVPLALEESVRLLADRRDIQHRRGAWARRCIPRLRVPPTVRESVRERVARLDPQSRSLLEAAAVLAEPVDAAVLARVAELDEPAARQGLAATIACGLLQDQADVGRVGFRHTLAAQATYEAIAASERRRLHQRAADALRTADPPPAAQLARHCREAGDVAGWTRYGEAAAEIALAAGDDRRAVVLLHELLTGADHPADRRARLARVMGRAAVNGKAALGGFAGEVETALGAVVADPELPPHAHGELRLLLGKLQLQLGQFTAGFAQLEAAVPDLEHDPALAARAMVQLALPSSLDWPASRHLRWLDRMTALLPRIAPGPERIACLVGRADALLMLGEPAGWDAVAEVPDTGATPQEWQQIARGLRNAGFYAMLWGRYGQARELLEAAIQLHTSLQYQRSASTVRVVVAHLDWCTGAWPGLAQRAAELADDEEVLPHVRLDARLTLGLLELATGDRAAAEPRFRAALEETVRHGLADVQMDPAAALGRLCLADGEIEEALRVTGPAMEIIAGKRLWLQATELAPVRVQALVAAGQSCDATALVHQFASWLADRRPPAPAAALATCQALLVDDGEDPDKAAIRFAEAAAAWATLPRPYDELLAVERQGRCLLAAGRRPDAVTLLADAERRLSALGASWDADRVARLLRRHGVDVSRGWQGGQRGYGDRLSPRELEVVRLAATGLTNRQIAERLFLSPKTVSQHLGAATRKLGVASRTALVLAAVDAGLLSGPDRPDSAPAAAGRPDPDGDRASAG